MKLDLSWLRRRLPEDVPQLQDKLEDTSVILDSALDSIRQLSRQLRPRALDDIGLVGACETLLRQLESQYGLRTMLCLSDPELELETTFKTALYRILQQALSNIGRHARATCVQVHLVRSEGHLTIRIVDDGQGFLPEAVESAGAQGLVEMRERVLLLGGEMELASQPGQGTRLHIKLPLGSSVLPLEFVALAQ